MRIKRDSAAEMFEKFVIIFLVCGLTLSGSHNKKKFKLRMGYNKSSFPYCDVSYVTFLLFHIITINLYRIQNSSLQQDILTSLLDRHISSPQCAYPDVPVFRIRYRLQLQIGNIIIVCITTNCNFKHLNETINYF